MGVFGGAVLGAALLLAGASASGVALAARATLVVDADGGRVLHAENANLRSFPASTTKMMTAYLAFEALAKGELKLDEDLAVSAHAAGQGGQSLELEPGTRIKARDALVGMLVESANDAAVVLAERLGGGEAAFAERMTAKARELGMARTRFRNASGLNHPEQVVTARDMAVLALALLRDFPDRYGLFATRGFAHKGESYTTVNGFLVNYPGADGIKTGFTCAAGYNLVASAVRGGRRLVAVVLGETSRGERAGTVAELMNAGFAKPAPEPARTLADLDPTQTGEPDPPPQGVIAESCASIIATPGAPGVGLAGLGVPGVRAAGWSVEVVGGFADPATARAIGNRTLAREPTLRGGRIGVLRRRGGGVLGFRPLVLGLTEQAAKQGCFRMRQRGLRCIVLSPQHLVAAAEQAAMLSRAAKPGRR
ncbi:MAG TPA: D-alanyl-D-alanine carboxypeptidase family protein [Azospirillum sp.]|nr:D-alanyl-D-alanine carboxypeptidase family protein [Azospirillum sp.]